MTSTVNQVSEVQIAEVQIAEVQSEKVEVKTKAAYLIQRENRKSFTFGKVWNKAVQEGKVTDKQKLVAQAVKLKVGRKWDMNKLKFETLLMKVQKALAEMNSTE